MSRRWCGYWRRRWLCVRKGFLGRSRFLRSLQRGLCGSLRRVPNVERHAPCNGHGRRTE